MKKVNITEHFIITSFSGCVGSDEGTRIYLFLMKGITEPTGHVSEKTVRPPCHAN